MPEQIWKKQITLRTRNIQLITPYATGTIIVQKKKRYAYKHENVDNREFECLSDMEHGERRLAACQKRDDYAYRAEKITEHGKNLVVGNILRVELCGVVVGIALRRNGGVLGYTAAVPERIRKCARRSWRKMWQRRQVVRCN